MKVLFILVLALAIFGTAGFFTYELFVHPQQALREEKLLPPPPPAPDPSLPEFEKCVAVRKSGKLLEARDVFYSFLEHFPDSTKIEDAKYILGEINTSIFLSTLAAPEKEVYIVKSGDVITRVANRLKTTPELLMLANNLDNTMLRIGQKLTISPSEFSLVISRKHDRVTILNKGRFFKQYSILPTPATPAKTPSSIQHHPAGPPKLTGKVTDETAWVNGGRVVFSDKGYADAFHWIIINIPGCSLFPPEGDGTPAATKPPGGGLLLQSDDVRELAAMIKKGTPVTIQ